MGNHHHKVYVGIDVHRQEHKVAIVPLTLGNHSESPRKEAQLLDIEMEINTITRGVTKLTKDEGAGLRDEIREWLEQALEIAGEPGPRVAV